MFFGVCFFQESTLFFLKKGMIMPHTSTSDQHGAYICFFFWVCTSNNYFTLWAREQKTYCLTNVDANHFEIHIQRIKMEIQRANRHVLSFSSIVLQKNYNIARSMASFAFYGLYGITTIINRRQLQQQQTKDYGSMNYALKTSTILWLILRLSYFVITVSFQN